MNAELGKDVKLGQFNIIGAGAKLLASTGDLVTIKRNAIVRVKLIGKFVTIGDWSKVEGSVILQDHISIGSYTEINNAMIQNNVIIGNHVKIDKGSIVCPGTFVGDHAVIGMHMHIPPSSILPEYSMVFSNEDLKKLEWRIRRF